MKGPERHRLSALQIYPGKGCPLDAQQIDYALTELCGRRTILLIIENVGSLVCLVLFDLGEAGKMVMLSVTEARTSPSNIRTCLIMLP